jgi:hypothetical protein
MRLIAERANIVCFTYKDIVAVKQHNTVIAFEQKLLLDGGGFMAHFKFQIH